MSDNSANESGGEIAEIMREFRGHVLLAWNGRLFTVRFLGFSTVKLLDFNLCEPSRNLPITFYAEELRKSPMKKQKIWLLYGEINSRLYRDLVEFDEMSCADFVIITLGDGYLSTKVVSEEELKERLKRTTDS